MNLLKWFTERGVPEETASRGLVWETGGLTGCWRWRGCSGSEEPGEPGVFLCLLVRLCEAPDCGVVIASTEIVLVEAVGGDQLLASELVGLFGRIRAEVGDDRSVGIVRDSLLQQSCRAFDDCEVVVEVVLGVVMKVHSAFHSRFWEYFCVGGMIPVTMESVFESYDHWFRRFMPVYSYVLYWTASVFLTSSLLYSLVYFFILFFEMRIPYAVLW